MNYPAPIILRPIIQVPPPTIIQPPENIWTTWVFPSATLVAAFLAAFVSIILWRKALEQIDLAIKSLNVAKDELALVKNDLEFSKQQVDYLNRRAVLATTFDMNSKTMFATKVLSDGYDRLWLPIRLFLGNDGKRTARDVMLILYISPESRPVTMPGLKRPLHPVDHYKDQGLRYLTNQEISGERRDKVTLSVGMPIFPGEPVLVHEFNLMVPHPGAWKSTILWRALCDDGASPESAPYGTLEVGVIERGQSPAS